MPFYQDYDSDEEAATRSIFFQEPESYEVLGLNVKRNLFSTVFSVCCRDYSLLECDLEVPREVARLPRFKDVLESAQVGESLARRSAGYVANVAVNAARDFTRGIEFVVTSAAAGVKHGVRSLARGVGSVASYLSRVFSETFAQEENSPRQEYAQQQPIRQMAFQPILPLPVSNSMRLNLSDEKKIFNRIDLISRKKGSINQKYTPKKEEITENKIYLYNNIKNKNIESFEKQILLV